MATETKNKVLYGIEKCYIAKITETEGTITYGTPILMPGVTGLSPEPQGETTKFYADDIVYYIATSNQGYQGDLVLAVTPEQFLTEILGQEKDKNGAIIENADDTSARFALMFEGKGDTKARRWVYWDCTATRPSREHSTRQENIEIGTEKITITMSPRATDKAVKCHIEPNEANQAVYDAFFTKVYEKDATAEV